MVGVIITFITAPSEAAPYFSCLGSCIKPNYNDEESTYIYLPLILIIPFTIIAITTTWTFVFTQVFLRKNLKRHRETLNDDNFTTQKKKYISRIKNLVGIFGVLLVSNILFMFPLLLGTLFSSTSAFEEIPKGLTIFMFVFFLFSFVSNPIIQAYFRRDLKESFMQMWKKLCLTKSFCVAASTSKNEESVTRESHNM